jgi:hypothetical protein
MRTRLTLPATLGLALATASVNAQTPASTPAPAAPTPPKADTNVTVTDLTPTQGALPALLKTEIAKATAQNLTPFVELGATWCGPCHHLQNSLGDKRMIDAFSGTYIIRLDVDAWKDQLKPLGFVSDSIPAIFAIDAAGKATGPVITGGAWGEDIPENMAPPLKTFFRANLRKS